MDVILSVGCTDEYADSPAWVRFTVDDELVSKLTLCRDLIKAHGLSVVKFEGRMSWQAEDEFRCRGDSFSVHAGNTFWPDCYPKYGGFHFEGRAVELNEFIDAYHGRVNWNLCGLTQAEDGNLYYSDDYEDLVESVTDSVM